MCPCLPHRWWVHLWWCLLDHPRILHFLHLDTMWLLLLAHLESQVTSYLYQRHSGSQCISHHWCRLWALAVLKALYFAAFCCLQLANHCASARLQSWTHSQRKNRSGRSRPGCGIRFLRDFADTVWGLSMSFELVRGIRRRKLAGSRRMFGARYSVRDTFGKQARQDTLQPKCANLHQPG